MTTSDISETRSSLSYSTKPQPGWLRRRELLDCAHALAPDVGYNPTRLGNVRLLKSETDLHDVPVLYKPGAVFVLQGCKRGLLDDEVYLYDEQHYLAVSVPVPFRMESRASKDSPLLAVYIEFDMRLAAELAVMLDVGARPYDPRQAKGLVSSAIDAGIEDVLLRLLHALNDPVETKVLGASILHELHYRVLIGDQGSAMIRALQQHGVIARIGESIARLRETFVEAVSIGQLAREAGMSVASYHVHFKAVTGSTPLQYIKAMRLHEARLMLAESNGTIAEIAANVGYASPAQFSRDFKRHFRRTASEEARWVRMHIGVSH